MESQLELPLAAPPRGPRVRLVLGPAGSGKTHGCLSEIRSELARAPEGAPLLLIAPKQATFQLERQLLEGGIAGWTRLQILSFDRLARQVLEQREPVDILSEEGRIMILRALLRRHHQELRIFRSSARLAGFAQELSGVLREFSRHNAGPAQLEARASALADNSALADKLRDFATILRAYRAWLGEQRLHDPDMLPVLAADAIREGTVSFRVEGVWLDGFAEMTPLEIDLLAAVVSRSRHATLAFCCETGVEEPAPSWLSPWSIASRTAARVHDALQGVRGAELRVERLTGRPRRFEGSPALALLERTWATGATPEPPAPGPTPDIRMVSCAHLEEEATVAAREVLRHVRAGGRFREIAILARSLDDVHATLQRVLSNYGIPFFIDRRAPMAHHPLAELVRGVLRLTAYRWRHEDWFGILKTGLTPAGGDWIDRVENRALAGGWPGLAWRDHEIEWPTEADGAFARRLTEPFAAFESALGSCPEAGQVADALLDLWERLEVGATLERWSRDEHAIPGSNSALVHASALEQMTSWLDDFRRGFAGESMPPAEWLAIIEAGLASLTAGVIPPAQDQVLVGAIDRSRQPELHTAIVIGLNEGRFPRPPGSPGILTEWEQDLLLTSGAPLLSDRRQRVGHERYYGYIAFTRARRRLVLTWSERDEDGQPFNPSPFIRNVRRLFPDQPVESGASDAPDAELPAAELPDRLQHPAELLVWLLAHPGLDPRLVLPEGGGWRERASVTRRFVSTVPDRLRPDLVRELLGPEPEVSVSALESLSACPFQFVAKHALRARERRQHEIDPRQVGTIAHALLARFHAGIRDDGLSWGRIRPEDARRRMSAVADQHPAFQQIASWRPEERWRLEGLRATLEDIAALLVEWAADCGFEPTDAEIEIGHGGLPSWRVEAGPGEFIRVTGKVDRVDVFRPDRAGPPAFIIVDYKLKERKWEDDRVRAGLDLQLASYAMALQAAGHPAEGATIAGMFYMPIQCKRARGKSRARETGANCHRHAGRFRESAVSTLDPRRRGQGCAQFRIAFYADGTLAKKCCDGVPDSKFDDLLAGVRTKLSELGALLLAGDFGPHPFRMKSKTACMYCNLQTVCRFDPWTQPFRRIEKA